MKEWMNERMVLSLKPISCPLKHPRLILFFEKKTIFLPATKILNKICFSTQNMYIFFYQNLIKSMTTSLGFKTYITTHGMYVTTYTHPTNLGYFNTNKLVALPYLLSNVELFT